MSTTSFFRRPTYRAPSPPTWACYEQIPYGSEDESASDSGSESGSDAADDESVHNMDINAAGDSARDEADESEVEAMVKQDVKGKQRAVEPDVQEAKPAEPKTSPRRERRKRERPAYNPRPILTIHKSQGFVWNQVCSVLEMNPGHDAHPLAQDLFVPPYIKDRCTPLSLLLPLILYYD
jgi:hypothetical protein